MKIIKYILIALGVIVAALLITALFLPKEYTVSRDITINRSKSDVFDYARKLENQLDYSVWWKMDPNQVTTFTGEDGTIGFVAAWKSELDSVGSGEEEIVALEEGKRIGFALRFKEPFESSASSEMLFAAPDSNSTKLTWNFEGDMSYPLNVMQLFISMEDMLGQDIQEGLQNMKVILEKEGSSSNQFKLPNWQWSEDGWRWTQVRPKDEGC
ncbi:MAG: SRPBCC family protein [Flavobacteriales bacterium]